MAQKLIECKYCREDSQLRAKRLVSDGGLVLYTLYCANCGTQSDRCDSARTAAESWRRLHSNAPLGWLK